MPSDFGDEDLKCRSSKDGSVLAVANRNEFLVFEFENNRSLARQIIRREVPQLAAIDICSTGHWLVTSSSNGIEKWDAKTGRRMHSCSNVRPHRDLKIGPRDEFIALANGNAIDLLSTREWITTLKIARGESPISHIEFSPNGRILAFVREKQNQIELFDLHRNQLLSVLTTSRLRPWFEFSADSRLLMHQGRLFAVAFWDLEALAQRLHDLKLLD